MEFKVGDKVIVKDNGCSFTTYRSFFKENGLEKWEPLYAEHRNIPEGEAYTIVGIGKHEDSFYGPLYLLQGKDGKIYIGNNNHHLGKDYMELANETIYASELMELARKNPQEYEGKRYTVAEGSAMYNCATAGKRYTECKIISGDLYANDLPMMIFSDTILEEILPEPKPVPFMEAVKAYSEGKIIRCKLDECESTYQSNKPNDTFCQIESLEILNGTWHILD